MVVPVQSVPRSVCSFLGGHLLSLFEFLPKGSGDTCVSETKLKGRDGARLVSRIVACSPHPSIVPFVVGIKLDVRMDEVITDQMEAVVMHGEAGAGLGGVNRDFELGHVGTLLPFSVCHGLQSRRKSV